MEQHLDEEINYFYSIQDELKAKYPEGGFVVIKDKKVFGIWLNRNDAIKEAIEHFGNVQVLVKNISDNINQFINFSRPISFTHGISYNS